MTFQVQVSKVCEANGGASCEFVVAEGHACLGPVTLAHERPYLCGGPTKGIAGTPRYQLGASQRPACGPGEYLRLLSIDQLKLMIAAMTESWGQQHIFVFEDCRLIAPSRARTGDLLVTSQMLCH